MDGREQSLVIQIAKPDEPFHLFLREHTRKPFGLANTREDESSRFLESHVLVVVLQSENGMFKERQTVAIPVQKHSQIVIDVCLCKIVRKFLEIQYRLRNLQAIRVDSTVRVQSQVEFLCEKRTDAKPSAIQACLVMAEVRRRKTKLDAFLKIGKSFNRPVQGVVGHGVL